ncbi:MAG: oxidoreductase [bacterium]|nr:oxidoreductase [bacterium]
MSKLKLALYWAGACGGCDVAVLDTNEKIFDIAKVADIVLWPIALDHKYQAVKTMADGEIDVALFNGCIRNSENEELAHLLRQKAKILVAFGSCSHLGGIPGLANLASAQQVFDIVYQQTFSTVNPDKIVPQPKVTVPEGELYLPVFYNTVSTLAQIVAVDYYVPGCPPAVHQIVAVWQAIASGNLPPKGSVVGASNKTLCDECERKKEEKKITKFSRPHTVVPDKERCFLEQGIICMGPATRGGCGLRCIKSMMPCRGCYGPAPGAIDQGAKMISAVSSIIDSKDPNEIQKTIDQIEDPIGTFYRFSLPQSLLKRSKLDKDDAG